MATDNKNNLSEAAKTMRTDPDQKKRSEAAKVMGHEGGTHSHDNDPNRKNRNNENQD
jgi:hypothetical protein